MVANLFLWVNGGLGTGKGFGNGRDVCCCVLFGGRVSRHGGMGGLLSIVSMSADKSAMALDMSTIASSRQSMALETRKNESCSQGVHIMGVYGVRGRSKSMVGWVCVVASSIGVVIAALLVAVESGGIASQGLVGLLGTEAFASSVVS